MRVLLLEDKKIDSYEVVEVIDMGYDDDITCIKDPVSGQYDIFGKKPIAGLFIVDKDNSWIYLPGLTKEQCNKICMTALKYGYVDLTQYGEYVPEEVYFPDNED